MLKETISQDGEEDERLAHSEHNILKLLKTLHSIRRKRIAQHNNSN